MKQNLRKPSHFIWKAIILLGLLLLAFGLAMPALADYLGPDRTRTESHVETYDWGVWAKPDPTGDSCVHTYGTDCVVCTWERDPGFPCGDATYWYKVGERSEVVTTTHTYPESSISGSINCSQMGNNGWCVGTASLSLSASEPVAGYSITIIEGTCNGETFACPGSSCSVPLLEGQNDFTFWALSSWGDSSLMGSASGKVDTQPPVISGSLNGTTGDNGWFISPVTLSASASDPAPGSGLSTLEYSLDGSGWTVFAGGLTLTDGSHAINLHAVDNAGNTSTASQSVHVDSEPPQVSLTGVFSFCPACGESLTIAYSAQDNTSGIFKWTLLVDGVLTLDYGTTQTTQTISWDASGFPAGTHTLTLHASDQAGNTAETSLDVTILAPTPTPTPVPPRPIAPTATADIPFVPSSPTPSASPTPLPTLTRTPTATRTSSVFIFGGGTPTQVGGIIVPSNPDDQPAPDLAPQPNILWGAAAAAAIGAATAYALEQRRKRKEEEAREQAKAMEEVARRNAEAEAVKVQNWLASEAARKEEAMLAAEQADMTEAEKLAAYKQTDRYQSYQEKMQKWGMQQAAQTAAPSAGTRSLPTSRKDKGLTKAPPPQEKSWWQKALDATKTFVQEKIVEPVQKAWNRYVYKPIIQPAAKWVQDHVVQPVRKAWNTVTTAVRKAGDAIHLTFRAHPVLAWGTAAAVTITTLLGGYHVYCYGLPGVFRPISSLLDLARMGALPLAGLLTTDRKKRLYSVLVGLLMLGMLVTACAPQAPSPTSTPTLCPQAATPAPTNTPVPPPMATPTPPLTADSLNSSVPLYQLAAYLYANGLAPECAPDKQNSPECLAKIVEWQNKYNQIILEAANDPNSEWRLKYPNLNIDPAVLAVMYKRIVMNESQFIPGWVTGSEQGTGLAQVTPDTLKLLANAGLIQIPGEVNVYDNTALVALLQDPAFNARAGMANLIYLYQGIEASNLANETVEKPNFQTERLVEG
jgi:hypothetical protein